MAQIDFSLQNRIPDGNGKLLVGDLSPTDGSYTTEQQYLEWMKGKILYSGYLYNGDFYKESAHTNVISKVDGAIYVDLSDGTNLSLYYCDNTTYKPLTEEAQVQAIIDGLNDGTIVPLKAKQDQNGNVIDQTYETKADASDLKSAISFNRKRIENLEQKSGSVVDVDYPNYSVYGEVPTGKAKNAIVSKMRGVTVAYNQQFDITNPSNGPNVTNYQYSGTSFSWHDTADNSNFISVGTITSQHKYFVALTNNSVSNNLRVDRYNTYSGLSGLIAPNGRYATICDIGTSTSFIAFCPDTWTADRTLSADDFEVTDLTQMFGPSVADYLYSIEQATTGAGVALFKALVKAQDKSHETGRLVSTTYSAVESYSANILDNTSFVKGRVDAGVIGYASDTSSMTITETGVDFTVTNGWRGVVSGLIRVKPNTTYTLNFTATVTVYAFASEYTSSGSFIVTSGVNSPFPSTFTTSATTGLIRLSFQIPVVGSISITNLTIKAGNDGTYTPHLLDTLTLPSSVTLRGILKVVNNNLVVDGDEYDPETGEVTRKYAMKTLATNFGWNHEHASSQEIGEYDVFWRTATDILPNVKVFANEAESINGFITSLYPNVGRNKLFKKPPISTCIQTGATYVFMVCLPASLNITTSTAFNEWLAQNPLTVIYQLATPTSDTPLDPVLNPTLATEGGGTLSTTQTNDPAIVSAMQMTYMTL